MKVHFFAALFWQGFTMIARLFLFSFFLLPLLPGLSQALAAPGADVVGKSVVVRWTENRQQRINNAPELRAVTVGFELQIYVGATGRPFARLTASRGGSHSNEQVGAQGQSLGEGSRSIRADGNSITLQANYGNIARNLRIEVATGGAGCSAQMSVGKEAGSAPKAFRSGGRTIEIHSTSVGGVSCSIRQGNVFGG
jgi:hypothetical protein